MPNPWFRCYSEMVNDPKLQALPESMRWRWIAILCLRCDETLETLHDSDIAFQLRISDADLFKTKALFIDKEFIDEQWNVLNWNKRQFVSDSSTERVRRYREKKKNAQNPLFSQDVTDGNVTVTGRNGTDTDTDTDTDTEQKNTSASSANALPADKVLGTLPLIDGTEWEVHLSFAKELQNLYRAVDVGKEFRSMKGWLIGNPANRKTRRGIKRFITSWLEREQNKAKPNGVKPNGKIETTLSATQIALANVRTSNGAGRNSPEAFGDALFSSGGSESGISGGYVGTTIEGKP